jgi:mono/diheme cytochrome c family protein
MRSGLSWIVCAMLVLSGSLAFARRERESKPYAELAQVPDTARARLSPFQNDSDAVVAGKKLFERHCQECHGAAGVGGGKGPSLLAPEVQTASSGAIFWVLTNGSVRSGMPVWSKLPEAQRWQITAYLKSLGTSPADDRGGTK